MESNACWESTSRIRACTLRAGSSFFICALPLAGSVSPSAHWASLRCLAGRALLGADGVEVTRFSFEKGAGWIERESPAAVSGERRSGSQLGKYRWAVLRHQGRQRQVQTRLKSMCRRATRATPEAVQ